MMPPLLPSILARHLLRSVALLIALFWLAASIAPAHSRVFDSWYVATFGSDQNDCRKPATPCATVSAVLNHPDFVPGTTVFVEKGTYQNPAQAAQALYIDRDVVLSGGWNVAYTEQTGFSYFYGENRTGITVGSGVLAEFYYIGSSGGRVRGMTSSESGQWTDGGLQNFGTLLYYNSGASGFWGYGIYNSGVLTMTDSDAGAVDGIGIVNVGTLYAERLEIKDTTTETGCAGIENHGELYLRSSLIKDNRAHYGNGAVCNYGVATVADSTITRNISTDTAESSVGGIDNYGQLLLINTLVADNYGHFISDIHNSGELYLANTTVKSETLEQAGIVNALGGQIYSRNSIIWECMGAIKSDGYNLLVESAGCDWQAAAGDQLDRNPFLDETHTPRPGSVVLNRGNPAGCRAWDGSLLATDGRGAARWRACDIGAYEYVPPLGEIFTRHLPLVGRDD